MSHSRGDVWCHLTPRGLVIVRLDLSSEPKATHVKLECDIVDMMIYSTEWNEDREIVCIMALRADSSLVEMEIDCLLDGGKCKVTSFPRDYTPCVISDSVIAVSANGAMINYFTGASIADSHALISPSTDLRRKSKDHAFSRPIMCGKNRTPITDSQLLIDCNTDWRGCSVWGAGDHEFFRLMICDGSRVISISVVSNKVRRVTQLRFKESVVRITYANDLYFAFLCNGIVEIRGIEHSRQKGCVPLNDRFYEYVSVFDVSKDQDVKWLCKRRDGKIDMLTYSTSTGHGVTVVSDAIAEPSHFVMPRQYHTMNVIR